MNLFEKVKCRGFYKKVHDGNFVVLDKQNLTATHMNSNLIEQDCVVEECVDRVEKTYYEHVSQNFKGVVVGYVDLVLKGYLDIIYQDEVDVGVGIIPEAFYVTKTAKDVVKCAIVYYANNKKHYVPVDEMEALKDEQG